MKRYGYLLILLILITYVSTTILVDSNENRSYGVILSISDSIVMPGGIVLSLVIENYYSRPVHLTNILYIVMNVWYYGRGNITIHPSARIYTPLPIEIHPGDSANVFIEIRSLHLFNYANYIDKYEVEIAVDTDAGVYMCKYVSSPKYEVPIHITRYKRELTYPLEIEDAKITVKYNETLLTLLLRSNIQVMIFIREILINDYSVPISSSGVEEIVIKPYKEYRITMPIYTSIYEDREYIVIIKYDILGGENINDVAKKARVVFSIELPTLSP